MTSPLLSAQIVPGSLLFLPSLVKVETPSNQQVHANKLRKQQRQITQFGTSYKSTDGGFKNHPVVILRKGSEVVYFFTLTSFGDRTLREKSYDCRHPDIIYRNHVPIEPSPWHPYVDRDFRYRNLRVAKGTQARDGYVNVGSLRCMHWQDLEHYGDIRRGSLTILTGHSVLVLQRLAADLHGFRMTDRFDDAGYHHSDPRFNGDDGLTPLLQTTTAGGAPILYPTLSNIGTEGRTSDTRAPNTDVRVRATLWPLLVVAFVAVLYLHPPTTEQLVVCATLMTLVYLLLFVEV